MCSPCSILGHIVVTCLQMHCQDYDVCYCGLWLGNLENLPREPGKSLCSQHPYVLSGIPMAECIVVADR